LRELEDDPALRPFVERARRNVAPVPTE
jgi:hypothetical protein